MEDQLRIRPGLQIPLSEIEIRASRSSGPGGQHANVTESRIEAIFDVFDSATLSDSQRQRLVVKIGPRVSAVAQDARSQARNRDLALQRLARKIADALHVPKQRRRTRPSRSARERRLTQKRQRSEVKRQRRRPGRDD